MVSISGLGSASAAVLFMPLALKVLGKLRNKIEVKNLSFDFSDFECSEMDLWSV